MGQRRRRKSTASREDKQTSSRLRLLRGQPLRFALVGVVALALVALAGAGAPLAGGGGSETATKSAAIVDQLSLTQPNPEFVSSARGILAEAGYGVDYFPGEQGTVDLYRTLPERHYDLIILRV